MENIFGSGFRVKEVLKTSDLADIFDIYDDCIDKHILMGSSDISRQDFVQFLIKNSNFELFK